MNNETIGQAEQLDRELDKSLAREVVMTLARGNILLQSGAYLTEEDLEADREFMRNYKFRHLKSQP